MWTDLTWLPRFQLLTGTMIFIFVLIYSSYPTIVFQTEVTHRRINITVTKEIISPSSRSLMELNKIRMDLLHLKYAAVLNISAFHQPQSDKTMTYSCGKRCNGWGDRVRGVMSVYVLALLTRRRFMIDMDTPCSLSRFLQPNIVNWTFREPSSSSGQNRRRLVIGGMSFRKREINELTTVITSTNFVTRWESYDDISITTNGYLVRRALMNPHVNSSWLIGQLPTNMASDTKLFSLLFEILFKPTTTLTTAVERILHVPYKSLICVHIRQGKNPSNPHDSYFPLRRNITQTMISFLDTMMGEINVDDTRIFVTSDSDAAIQQMRRHFLNAVVTVRGTIVHIDRTYTAKKRLFTHENICEGFLKVLTEFFVLGECDISVLSRSGFSAWASRRRVKRDNMVYLHNDIIQSMVRVEL